MSKKFKQNLLATLHFIWIGEVTLVTLICLVVSIINGEHNFTNTYLFS
jgi:hypothetical protein